MQERLSPRESRRLQRRFLQTDERATRPPIMLAGRPAPSRPAPPPPPDAPVRGPYEWDYPVTAGYTTDRTIIVP